MKSKDFFADSEFLNQIRPSEIPHGFFEITLPVSALRTNQAPHKFKTKDGSKGRVALNQMQQP